MNTTELGHGSARGRWRLYDEREWRNSLLKNSKNGSCSGPICVRTRWSKPASIYFRIAFKCGSGEGPRRGSTRTSSSFDRPAGLASRLANGPEEASLVAQARLRRDLAAALQQWRTITAGPDADARSRVEAVEAEARAALEAWQTDTGAVMG